MPSILSSSASYGTIEHRDFDVIRYNSSTAYSISYLRFLDTIAAVVLLAMMLGPLAAGGFGPLH